MFIFGVCKSQAVTGSLSCMWALDSPLPFIVSVSVPVPHSILTTTALYCDMKSSIVIHFCSDLLFLVGKRVSERKTIFKNVRESHMKTYLFDKICACV